VRVCEREDRSVAVLRRYLSANECAVVVRRRGHPWLVRGPASVRTFWRWKRVVVIDLGPLTLETAEEGVRTSDDVAVTVELRIGARVTDPLDAAVKVADYRQATCQMVRVVSRVIVGDFLRDQLSSEREQIESAIRTRSDSEMRTFGVAVSSLDCTFVQRPAPA
jgi:regulator of protease activity HflC (stomatin/prohibitin superfamily)